MVSILVRRRTGADRTAKTYDGWYEVGSFAADFAALAERRLDAVAPEANDGNESE
jgi:hypothetical protein